MEIGVEVNKVVGNEMAKLIASTISEDELINKANIVWQNLTRKNGNGFFATKPEIDTLVQTALLERFKDAIQKYLDQEIIKTDIRMQAKEIVEEIRKETERKIIDRVSDDLSVAYSPGGLKKYVVDLIEDTLRR